MVVKASRKSYLNLAYHRGSACSTVRFCCGQHAVCSKACQTTTRYQPLRSRLPVIILLTTTHMLYRISHRISHHYEPVAGANRNKRQAHLPCVLHHHSPGGSCMGVTITSYPWIRRKAMEIGTCHCPHHAYLHHAYLMSRYSPMGFTYTR